MITAFIFAGDMLVMLFMVCLVVWLFWRTPKEKLDYVAHIPLEDEGTLWLTCLVVFGAVGSSL